MATLHNRTVRQHAQDGDSGEVADVSGYERQIVFHRDSGLPHIDEKIGVEQHRSGNARSPASRSAGETRRGPIDSAAKIAAFGPSEERRTGHASGKLTAFGGGSRLRNGAGRDKVLHTFNMFRGQGLVKPTGREREDGRAAGTAPERQRRGDRRRFLTGRLRSRHELARPNEPKLLRRLKRFLGDR